MKRKAIKKSAANLRGNKFKSFGLKNKFFAYTKRFVFGKPKLPFKERTTIKYVFPDLI